MFDLLPWFAMLGVAITTASAMGTKVLREFSRHDLELYCRRRNTQHLFDAILDRRFCHQRGGAQPRCERGGVRKQHAIHDPQSDAAPGGTPSPGNPGRTGSDMTD